MPRSHVCPEEEAEEEEEEVCVFVMCALRQHKPQGPALVKTAQAAGPRSRHNACRQGQKEARKRGP